MTTYTHAWLVVGSFIVAPVAGVIILGATGATLGATVLAYPTIAGGVVAIAGAKRIYTRLGTPKDQPRPAILDTGELVILSSTGIAGAFMVGGPVVGLLALSGVTQVLEQVEDSLAAAPPLEKIDTSKIKSVEDEEEDYVVISSSSSSS